MALKKQTFLKICQTENLSLPQSFCFVSKFVTKFKFNQSLQDSPQVTSQGLADDSLFSFPYFIIRNFAFKRLFSVAFAENSFSEKLLRIPLARNSVIFPVHRGVLYNGKHESRGKNDN